MPEAREIPDKLLFRIGEVCELLDVRPHVLRYWETEFPMLRPEKSRTNQRLYRRRHVEQLLEVKRLLYEEGYTIAGARKRLRRPASAPPPPEGATTAPEAGSPGLQSPTAGRIRVPAPAAPQAVGTAERAEPDPGEAPRPERSEAVLAALEARCQVLERDLQAERERAKAFRQQVRDELEQLARLAEAAAGPDGA